MIQNLLFRVTTFKTFYSNNGRILCELYLHGFLLIMTNVFNRPMKMGLNKVIGWHTTTSSLYILHIEIIFIHGSPYQ